MMRRPLAILLAGITCVTVAIFVLNPTTRERLGTDRTPRANKPHAPFHTVQLKALSSFLLRSGNPRQSNSPYSGLLTADQLPDGTFVSLKQGGNMCVHRPGKPDKIFNENIGSYDWQITLTVTGATEAILTYPEDGIAWSVNLDDGKRSQLLQLPRLQNVARTKSGMLAGWSDELLFLADPKGHTVWKQALKGKRGEWIFPAPVVAIGSTADGEFTALFAQPPTAISYDMSGTVVKRIRLQQDDYLSGYVVISKSGFWSSYGDTVQHFGLDGKKIGESHPHTTAGEVLAGAGDSIEYFDVDDKGDYQLSDGYAVYRFDENGNLLGTLGQGPIDDTIYYPLTFATLPDDRFLVLDERRNRVHLCASDGKYLALFTDALAKEPGGLQWTIGVGAAGRMFAEGYVNESSVHTVIALDGQGKEFKRTTFPPPIAYGDYIDGPPDTSAYYRDALGEKGAVLTDQDGAAIKDITNYDLNHTGSFAVYGYRSIYLMDANGHCLSSIPDSGDQDPIASVAFNGNIALVLKQDLGLSAYTADGAKLWEAPRKIGDDKPIWMHVALGADGAKFAMLDSDGRITWYAMPQ